MSARASPPQRSNAGLKLKSADSAGGEEGRRNARRTSSWQRLRASIISAHFGCKCGASSGCMSRGVGCWEEVQWREWRGDCEERQPVAQVMLPSSFFSRQADGARQRPALRPRYAEDPRVYHGGRQFPGNAEELRRKEQYNRRSLDPSARNVQPHFTFQWRYARCSIFAICL